MFKITPTFFFSKYKSWCRDYLLNGKAQYSWPPQHINPFCLKKARFINESDYTIQIGARSSTVLSLPLQLVFPVWCIGKSVQLTRMWVKFCHYTLFYLTPMACDIKLFMTVINSDVFFNAQTNFYSPIVCTIKLYLATVFASVSHFHSSLIFAGEDLEPTLRVEFD